MNIPEHGYPYTEEETNRLKDAIESGKSRQQIVTHQHFFQVQVSDLVLVKWCPSCGTVYTLTRYNTGGPWPSHWTKIKDEL